MTNKNNSNKSSRPFYDRLSFKFLLDNDIPIFNPSEQASLLLRTFDCSLFKLKTKQDIEMINCLFANLFDSHRTNKWIGIWRFKEKISDDYGYNPINFIHLIDFLIEKNFIQQILGSHEIHRLTEIIPTNIFAAKISSLLQNNKISNILLYDNSSDFISFNLTRMQQSRYLNSSPIIKEEYNSLLTKIKYINHIQSNILLISSNINNNINNNTTKQTSPLGGHESDNLSLNEEENPCSACNIDLKTLIKIKPVYRLQFGKSLNEHGRLYSFFQNTKEEDRLNWLFDNSPVIEKDFRALHPNMIYDLNHIPKNNKDMYQVTEGINHRDFWKVISMMCINTNSKQGALQALQNLYDGSQESLERIEKNNKIAEFVPGMKKKRLNKDNQKIEILYPEGFSKDNLSLYINQFIDYHKDIKQFLFKGNLQLMNLDGKIALNIIHDFSQMNKPIASFHDSFLVKLEDQNILEALMNKYYKQILNTTNSPQIKTLHSQISLEASIINSNPKSYQDTTEDSNSLINPFRQLYNGICSHLSKHQEQQSKNLSFSNQLDDYFDSIDLLDDY